MDTRIDLTATDDVLELLEHQAELLGQIIGNLDGAKAALAKGHFAVAIACLDSSRTAAASLSASVDHAAQQLQGAPAHTAVEWAERPVTPHSAIRTPQFR